ncbi:hypothetical protein [Paraburkholderia sp. A1RI_3L]|uniref:hypothetical protein n=1 Tax=Paraburkholderia sp. A1RI_3L TaxID=3029269 RepID=UPI003BA08867
MATYDWVRRSTRAHAATVKQARLRGIGEGVMELGNKERSLVSKVMDGFISGIVEERSWRDPAAAGCTVQRA